MDMHPYSVPFLIESQNVSLPPTDELPFEVGVSYVET